MTELYFAYGSNMSTDAMKARCPSACLRSIARAEDCSLEFTYSSRGWGGGVADIVPCPNSSVWGVIYEPESSDLFVLDRYEGVPHAYERMRITVKDRSGADLTAWTYRVVQKTTGVLPTNAYRQVLVSAARGHRFPDEYVSALLSIRCVGD